MAACSTQANPGAEMTEPIFPPSDPRSPGQLAEQERELMRELQLAEEKEKEMIRRRADAWAALDAFRRKWILRRCASVYYVKGRQVGCGFMAEPDSQYCTVCQNEQRRRAEEYRDSAREGK